jgi:mono/diheme cytochrome c family protein
MSGARQNAAHRLAVCRVASKIMNDRLALSKATLLASASLLSLVALASQGCASKAVDSPRSTTILGLKSDAPAGQAVFASKCINCHGADGRTGTAKHDIVDHAKNETTDFVNVVIAGKSGQMPSFGSLSDNEIANLLAYVKTL